MKGYYFLFLLMLSSLLNGQDVTLIFTDPVIGCQGDTVNLALTVASERLRVTDLIIYLETDASEVQLLDVEGPPEVSLILQNFSDNPDRFSISRDVDISGVGEAIDLTVGDTLALVTAVILLEGDGTIAVTEGFSVFRSNLAYEDESGSVGFSFIEISDLNLSTSTTIPVTLGEVESLDCINQDVLLAVLGEYPAGTEFSLRRGEEAVGHGPVQSVSAAGLYSWRVTRSVCETIVEVEVPIDTAFGARPQVRSELMQCGEETAGLEVVAPIEGYTYQWVHQGQVIGTGPVLYAVPGTYELQTINERNGCTDSQTITLEPARVSEELAALTLPVVFTRTCRDTTWTLPISFDPVAYGHELYHEGALLEGTDLNTLSVSATGVYDLRILQLDNRCERTLSFEVVRDDFSPAVSLAVQHISCSEPGSIEVINENDEPYLYWWEANGMTISQTETVTTTTELTALLTVQNERTGCRYQDTVAVYDDRTEPDFATFVTEAPNECGVDHVELVVVSEPQDVVSVHHENMGLVLGDSGTYFISEGGVTTVSVTNPAGCIFYDTITVPDFAQPLHFSELEVKVTDCSSEVLDATLLLGQVEGGNSPISITLNDAVVLPGTSHPLELGSNLLVATDARGCHIDTLITIAPERVVAQIQGFDSVYQAEHIVRLSAVLLPGLPASAYRWTYGDNVSTGPELVFQATETVFVQLEVNSTQGCKAVDNGIVQVGTRPRLYVPTAFNPRSSEVSNRVLGLWPDPQLRGWGHFEVYDRWGKLLFETEGPVQELDKWDGWVNGELVAVATYVYFLRYIDPKGNITDQKGEVIRL